VAGNSRRAEEEAEDNVDAVECEDKKDNEVVEEEVVGNEGTTTDGTGKYDDDNDDEDDEDSNNEAEDDDETDGFFLFLVFTFRDPVEGGFSFFCSNSIVNSFLAFTS
jgi:hypothetical protein